MRKLLWFFGGLYFLQGAALAYVVNFQKPFLAERGIDKDTIGLFTALLLIPFVGKVGLGWLSDRFGGRKAFMIAGLSVFAACYLALAGIDPRGNFVLFAAVSWVASLALALFDTCADGWAVDAAADHEQGPLQAAMIAGKALGLILAAGAFGHFADDFAFATPFRGLSVLAVVAVLVVAAMPHRRADGSAAPPEGGTSGSRPLKAGFAWLALFGIVYSVASFGTDGLVTLHLMETRLANAEVIGWFGMARGIGALVGAWAFVKLSVGLGGPRTRYAAVALLGGGCLLPLVGLEVGASGFGWGVCWGLQEASFVTLAMRFAKGPWAATVFAFAMIFSNLGTAIGEAVAAPLVPRIGYAGVFVTFAALAWASAALVPRTDPV